MDKKKIMEMPPAEIVDRGTILMVKVQEGFPSGGMIAEFKRAMKGFDPHLVQELFEINAQMFHMEEIITQTKNYEDIGRLYMRLRRMSLERNKIKNKITEKYGGYKEHKRY